VRDVEGSLEMGGVERGEVWGEGVVVGMLNGIEDGEHEISISDVWC